MDSLEEGKRIFDLEIEALRKTRDALDSSFIRILEQIMNCKGKVIITGMGKPGHIAAKLAATFSSLGIPSFRLHPAEALHGDLGMVSSNDVVVIISFSGESEEIIRILPNIRMIGAMIIGLTGNPNSTLAKVSDIVQVFPKFDEACHLGLAPTSSTTVALCYGDALAVVASEINGFTDKDFGKLHPAGSLGKKLVLKVEDLMARDDDIPKVPSGMLLKDAIPIMSKKGLGVVSIVDGTNHLQGIICDGDLRRLIEKHIDIYSVVVDDVMIRSPKTITKDKMAFDALHFIKQNSINNLPVIDNSNVLVGTITWQQIVKAGIVS